MIDPFLEKNYNMQATRDDLAEVMQGWSARSEQYRSHSDSSQDCRYGENESELIDVFRCGKDGAPLYIYLHGGYWQRGDKSLYSFVAEPFIAAGVDVAIIGYPLCPKVSMSSLVESIRRAIAWLYRNADSLGISADRCNLSGHSAGGHLTTMAICTDWPGFGEDLPVDLLKTGIPFSGLYELEPLLQTSISAALHLTPAEVQNLSPVRQQPTSTAPILMIIGGAESQEFFRQTGELMIQWRNPERVIDQHVEPDVDHFDLVERLASSDSQMFERIIGWLR